MSDVTPELQTAYQEVIKRGFSPVIPEEPREAPEALHERPEGMPYDVYKTVRKARKKAEKARLRCRRRITNGSTGTVYLLKPFGYFTHESTSPKLTK